MLYHLHILMTRMAGMNPPGVYITEDEKFYVPMPEEWRSKPENSKQGSGEPIDVELGQKHFDRLCETIVSGTEAYHDAMNDGVAPEIARLICLPMECM